MFPIEQNARAFAIAAHSAVRQVRKYTGLPYWYHCREVAGLVAAVTADPALAAAAWLHDVLEDTPITADDLNAVFPAYVVAWVHEVTDMSRPGDGNRKKRKEMDRAHLAAASPGGMTIKLADLISNTRSIVQHDPDFARVYLEEKAALIPLLVHGNAKLWDMACTELRAAEERLVQAALEPPKP